MNKRVLVAGGTGLVGSHLTKHLVKSDFQVTSTCFSRQPDNFQHIYKKYNFTKFEDCLEATKNMDYVFINAVQASGVMGLSYKPTTNLYPNLAIHAGLLEACAQNDVKKVVWISSSTVYQEYDRPISESEYNMNLETFPLYQGMGWLYRYIEKLAQHYYDRLGLPIGIIRTTSIYGPNDSFDDEKSHVIPALIKRALKKESPFVIWGNRDTTRDFIFVEDLIPGIMNVLEGYCNAKPINFSNGIPLTIHEAAMTILKVCNHNLDPEYDETKPTSIPYRVLCNKKYESVFGKRLLTDFETGISKTVEWYQNYIRRR